MSDFFENRKKLDLGVMIIPFILVFTLSAFLFIVPTKTTAFINSLTPLFRDKFTLLYSFVNLAVFIFAFYLSFSKYGNIVLGKKDEKPAFSFWSWGAMMFCAGLAGDILYYSFTEWLNYANSPYIQSLGYKYDYAPVESMYFWANYWFYLVLAVCFAFSMYCRNREKQKWSEALRGIFGNYVDGILGRVIDIFATSVIIIAVACSLTFTAPILAYCAKDIFHFSNTTIVSIIVLLLICGVYTHSVLSGLKGIKFLSNSCVFVFLILLAYILFFGGNTQYILESAFKQVGILVSNMPRLFTEIDPLRTTSFFQDYTSFYLAYWLTWAITVPYFISVISRGRTIKQTIMGGFLFAIPGGLLSYLIIPNHAVALQIFGKVDLENIYATTGDMYQIIIEIIKNLPLYPLPLIILIVSIICFCATSFDSISYTCSYYSYKKLNVEDVPKKGIRLFWAVCLIILPIALTFSSSAYNDLTNIAVLAGFPAAILMILAIISFLIDADRYIKESSQ